MVLSKKLNYFVSGRVILRRMCFPPLAGTSVNSSTGHLKICRAAFYKRAIVSVWKSNITFGQTCKYFISFMTTLINNKNEEAYFALIVNLP